MVYLCCDKKFMDMKKDSKPDVTLESLTERIIELELESFMERIIRLEKKVSEISSELKTKASKTVVYGNTRFD